MSMLVNRAAIVPLWLVVFGLFVLFESPLTLAAGLVLFLVAGVALTTMLVVGKRLPTPARMTAPNPPPALLPAPVFVANSWPDSGFRNSRRRDRFS